MIGSPKLRALMPLDRDMLLLYHEKCIIWYNLLAQQFFVAAALRTAGIKAEVFHSELSIDQRHKLINRFTTKDDDAPVLVCSYQVNSAGVNLQAKC